MLPSAPSWFCAHYTGLPCSFFPLALSFLLVCQSRLNENFLNLARELDIRAPKAPEDIYKTHLESGTRKSKKGG
jgi:hypothetical protein